MTNLKLQNPSFSVEGVNYEVDFNRWSRSFMKDMCLDKYTVSGAVMQLGERLNSYEHRERFIIVDQLMHYSYVCRMDRATSCVEVFSIVANDCVYIKEGVRVVEVNTWAKR